MTGKYWFLNIWQMLYLMHILKNSMFYAVSTITRVLDMDSFKGTVGPIFEAHKNFPLAVKHPSLSGLL